MRGIDVIYVNTSVLIALVVNEPGSAGCRDPVGSLCL